MILNTGIYYSGMTAAWDPQYGVGHPLAWGTWHGTGRVLEDFHGRAECSDGRVGPEE
jgi:hypothetical protein